MFALEQIVQSLSLHDNMTLSVLQAAACGNMAVIKLLENAGGKVNVRNTAGLTPLAHAASRGQAQLVSTLISMGCPVDTRNKDGTTPLHQAAIAGNQVWVHLSAVSLGPCQRNKMFVTPCQFRSKTAILGPECERVFMALQLGPADYKLAAVYPAQRVPFPLCNVIQACCLRYGTDNNAFRFCFPLTLARLLKISSYSEQTETYSLCWVWQCAEA